ncbi:unnamed protein product [Camellia sinensis]
MAEKGGPLPKFGEWDVNDPASAEGFTVIFNKARNEKKTGGKPESPTKEETAFKHGATLGKPQYWGIEDMASDELKNGFAACNLPMRKLEALELVRGALTAKHSSSMPCPHHIFFQ